MMKRERLQKTDSCCPSVKPAQKQNMLAPRPFAPPVEESEAPMGGSGISFNIADISILPRENVQPKLRLGPVSDRYEQEADRVARRVVETISSSDEGAVQRQEDLEDEDELDLEEEEELRLKVDGLAPAGGADVGPSLESEIQGARGRGQPLSDSVRQPMERAFGADFGGVRVHADAEADSLNRSIQARAFTTGQDIFLRQGEYRPGNFEGQRLLAHELTHVVQQNGGAERQPQASMSGSKVIQRGSLFSKKKSSEIFEFTMDRDEGTFEEVPSDVDIFETGYMGGCVTIIAMWNLEGEEYNTVIGHHMSGGVHENQVSAVLDEVKGEALIYVLTNPDNRESITTGTNNWALENVGALERITQILCYASNYRLDRKGDVIGI